MPMPFLESPFPSPDGDHQSPAEPVVLAPGAAGAIQPIAVGPGSGEALAWQLWAVRQQEAARRLHAAAAAPKPEPPLHPLGHDAVRLHRDAPADDPFASLVHHVLHVDLDPAAAPHQAT